MSRSPPLRVYYQRLIRPTVRSTSGLHRRSTFQPRLSANVRLASSANLPAPPSNSTSDSHRRSDPSASLPISLQLAPSTHLPAQPSSQPSTRAFRLASPANLPAPPSYRPATVIACRSSSLPSNQPPACAFDQSSGSTFPLTFGLRLSSAFRLCLQT